MDGNPHDPSSNLIPTMIVPVNALVIALERCIERGLLVGAVKG